MRTENQELIFFFFFLSLLLLLLSLLSLLLLLFPDDTEIDASYTKSQNLNVSRLILLLSLCNILKTGVKSRMKL